MSVTSSQQQSNVEDNIADVLNGALNALTSRT
jgi:hypothetical protein